MVERETMERTKEERGERVGDKDGARKRLLLKQARAEGDRAKCPKGCSPQGLRFTSDAVKPLNASLTTKAGSLEYSCVNCTFWQHTPTFNSKIFTKTVKEVEDLTTRTPYKANSHFIKPDGSMTPKVLFIGEAPGEQEDKEGKPFIGPAGRILRKNLLAIQIPEKDYCIHNVVACRPPNNKTPTFREMIPCSGFLGGIIAQMKPKVIATLGSNALKAITGNKDDGVRKYITEPSCKTHPFEITVAGHKCLLYPMFHPSYILRNDHLGAGYTQSFFDLKDLLAGDGSIEIRPDKQTERKWKMVQTPDEAIALLKKLQKFDGLIAFDYETPCLHPTTVKVQDFVSKEWHEVKGPLCVSFATKVGEAWSIPLNHEGNTWSHQDICTVEKELIKLFESNAKFIAQNAAFEMKWTSVHYKVYSIKRKIVFDTMLADFLLNENQAHGLDHLVMRMLPGVPMYWTGTDEWLKEHHTYAEMPLTKLCKYNAADADVTLDIAFRQMEKLKKFPGLQRMAMKFFPNASRFVSDLEERGAKLDVAYSKELVEEFESEITRRMQNLQNDPSIAKFSAQQLMEKIEKEKERIKGLKTPAGREKAMAAIGERIKFEFNPNSPDQLSAFMFDFMKFDPIKETKSGGDSTDEETMRWLAGREKCSLALDILNVKKVAKILGSYARPNLELAIDPANGHRGFLHGSFLLHGAKTGRLSSRDPSLHTQPSTGIGVPIRRTYVSRHRQGVILMGDFSQIELRLLAMLSQDKDMIRVYRDGIPVDDLHKLTCCTIFRMTPEQYDALDPKVQKLRRTISKRVNFGVAYGSGGNGIMTALAGDGVYIQKEEADSYQESFFRKYVGAKEYVDDTYNFIHKHGYVETVFKRRRRLPEIYSEDRGVVSRAERQGLNATIQSPASDMMVIAETVLNDLLVEQEMKSQFFITVHDSLGCDCVPEEVSEVYSAMKEVMENIPKYAAPIIGDDFDWSWYRDVPIKADFEVGYNWRDTVSLESADPKHVEERLEEAFKKQEETDDAGIKFDL